MSKKVLIIDDDIDVVEAMKIALESVGYEIESAGDSEEGFAKMLEFKPDLLILDVMMTTITEGFNAAWEIRSSDPSTFKHSPGPRPNTNGKRIWHPASRCLEC